MVQPDAETVFLADAIDAGEKFLRGHRAVERGARRQAIVARAAVLSGGKRLSPKYAQQFDCAGRPAHSA